MKRTSYTNYALRSLQLVALKSPDLVRVDDVTKIYGLSRAFMAILDDLKISDFLANRGQLMAWIAPFEIPATRSVAK